MNNSFKFIPVFFLYGDNISAVSLCNNGILEVSGIIFIYKNLLEEVPDS